MQSLAPKIVFGIFIGCYLASLALPGVFYKQDVNEPGNRVLYGYDILSLDAVHLAAVSGGQSPVVFIWIPIYFIAAAPLAITSIGTAAWYANVLILLTLIFIKIREFRWGFILSCVSFLVGLLALFHDKLPSIEGGTQYVDHLGAGYYLWQFSLAILMVYASIKFLESPNKNNIVR